MKTTEPCSFKYGKVRTFELVPANLTFSSICSRQIFSAVGLRHLIIDIVFIDVKLLVVYI